jgi:hypothetical protein
MFGNSSVAALLFQTISAALSQIAMWEIFKVSYTFPLRTPDGTDTHLWQKIHIPKTEF